jgi:hypothetical protein
MSAGSSGSNQASGLRSPATIARIAGLLWVVCVAGGIYAELFVRGTMIVHGNAAATASAIMAGEPAFRLGFAADLVADMAYLGVTLLLYALLKPAGRVTASIMLGFGLAGSAVMAANLVNLLAPIVLLRADGLSVGVASGLTPLVLLFLRLHGIGYGISIALFAVQVGAIGCLILRSSLFPRIFGVLFLIEAVCNAVSSFGGFLELGWVERLGTYILVPGLPAELGFALWLSVFAIDARRWYAVQAAEEPDRDVRLQAATPVD